MKRISRRKFIVRTGGTLSLLQLNALAQGVAPVSPLLNPKAEPKGWHHLNQYGADIYFHLINGHLRCGKLTPIDSGLPSYLIAQLPAQSLHEQYFYTAPNPPNDVPDGQLRAILSGPSFLAFELWPYQKGAGRRMPFTVEAMLDWENPARFRLLTIDDIPANQSESPQPADFWPQLNTKCDYKKLQLDPKGLGRSGLYDLDYYNDLTQKLLNGHPGKHLTIFELPAGIITAPISNIRTADNNSDRGWTPIVRQNQGKGGVRSIYETRYSFSKGRKQFIREVRERWNAEFEFLTPKKGQNGRASVNLPPIRSLPPALRIIGLLDRGDLGKGCEIKCDPVHPDPCNDPVSCPFVNPGYLPTLLDEAELLYLNQLGKQFFRGNAFDLKVTGPFLLTASGATLKFHYQNYNTKGLEDQSISLVEYEHHFQDGRDNFIKVSRIGVVCPSGQKALHVMIAQRKIDQGRSFIEYKEHIEFFEKNKDYRASAKTGSKQWENTPYFDFNLPEEDRAPWQPEYQYSNGLPFTSSEILVPQTPNMQPMGPGPTSFWVCRELPDGAAVGSFSDLIQVPVQYYDQNGKKIGKPSLHPILFMARSFFCGANGRSWIDGNEPTSLQKFNDQRIRIPLFGQIVAFTPDDPNPEQGAVPNKINQLATEWCEYVVNIAKPSAPSEDSVFDTAVHPIYPRMRRAKAFLDHLQQYGGKKLPSIINYEPPYLEYGLPNEKRTIDAQNAQNDAKVVLRHTNDFINGLVGLNRAALSGDLLDVDLAVDRDGRNGWNRIKTTFREAGARLGGMVNPDPLLERISLSPSSLSLPNGPLDKNLLKRLDPQQIFASVDADLFCGIRLKDILAIMEIDNLPKYLLNKLPDDFSDPQKALAAIGENTVVKKALQQVGSTAQIIKDIQAKVTQANTELASAQDSLNKLRISLGDQIADYNKLFGVVHLQFLATQSAYKPVLDDLTRLRLMVFETMKALQDLGLTNGTPKVAEFLQKNVYPVLINPDYTNSWKGLELARDLDDLRKDLEKANGDALAWGQATDAIFQDTNKNAEQKAQALFNLFSNLGAVLQTGDLAGPVPPPGSPNSNKFYHRSFILSKLFEFAKDRLPDAERGVWEVGLRQVDLLRRTAVDFYVDQRERMELELHDILRTSKLQIEDEQSKLQALADSANQYTQQLIEACQNSGFISAVTFASDPKNIDTVTNTAKEAFKAELIAAAKRSSIYKELGTRLNDYEDLGGKVKAAKETLEAAKGELISEAQKGAGTLLDQLDQSFEEQISALNDLQEIGEARAAYDKLKQLLTALKRQELSLKWQTDNFRPVDLGLVRFDPGSSPKTLLEMKVSAVMEMDPFKFPPVVQRTEIRTETRLTDFSITFFNVIGIKFSHVGLVSGTNTNTDLDVKISDVTFGGGLSFIQLLQKLLNGIVNGLRMEVGPTQVSIGFQTPTLNISSPGFTFSNFSVGMLLVIHFDRKPLELKFELAQPEKKATIAAGVYGGCFYCGLTVRPKPGSFAIDIDFSLAMGAYIGIAFGPFEGHVSFMVGLTVKKHDQGVFLEGYLIAEGLLSVWIISLCARLYMGVRSQNSYVEGFCVASYSVKVGFLEKTFTATYTKRVEGAASNAPGASSIAAVFQQFTKNPTLWRVGPSYYAIATNGGTGTTEMNTDVGIADLFLDEDRAMNEMEFMLFAKRFFTSTE